MNKLHVGVVVAFVLVLALTPAPAQPPPPPGEVVYPATGKIGPGLEPLDTAVVTMMRRHGIPGAALAVALDGKLLVARGYGWSNVGGDELARPDTLFGLASLSKTFTAVAILKLVEQGKLKLDDKVFGILDQIKPADKAEVDPRLKTVTVRQCLNHSGGWDSSKNGDPVNWSTRINGKRGESNPITAEQLIKFVMGLPLDYDPGTDCVYCNFGYVVLGEVIAKVSGQTYEDYVKENVLVPAGVRRTSLHPPGGKYFPNEARRYLAGTDTELPAWQQKQADAAGGWTGSALDMIRFLTALDGSRGKALLAPKTMKLMIDMPPPPLKSRDNRTHVGLGWDSVVESDQGFGYFKDGKWHGMRTYMKRSPRGVNWVLLFNASIQMDPTDGKIVADAVRGIREVLERQEKYPTVDLFGEF